LPFPLVPNLSNDHCGWGLTQRVLESFFLIRHIEAEVPRRKIEKRWVTRRRDGNWVLDWTFNRVLECDNVRKPGLAPGVTIKPPNIEPQQTPQDLSFGGTRLATN